MRPNERQKRDAREFRGVVGRPPGFDRRRNEEREDETSVGNAGDLKERP
jgi:hypothetical protein